MQMSAEVGAVAKSEFNGNSRKLFLPVSFKASKNPLGWELSLGSVTWFLPGSSSLESVKENFRKSFPLPCYLSILQQHEYDIKKSL